MPVRMPERRVQYHRKCYLHRMGRRHTRATRTTRTRTTRTRATRTRAALSQHNIPLFAVAFDFSHRIETLPFPLEV